MRGGRYTERNLHDLWLRCRPSASLQATDGTHVSVLDTGIPNTNGGPDFRNALVRIGSTLYRGDVELHLHAGSWEKHGHHLDPHYNSVILHVVLFSPEGSSTPETASGRAVPVAIVHPPPAPPSPASEDDAVRSCGECIRRTPARVVQEAVRRLGFERLNRKVTRCAERLDEIVRNRTVVLCEAGLVYLRGTLAPPGGAPSVRERSDPAAWDQLIYEGVFEALGYAKNKCGCAALARSVPLSLLRRIGLSKGEEVQGVLFGAAGLLPSPRRLPDAASRAKVRSMRRYWRAHRPEIRGPLLHESDWLFFRLRPSNFPTARIAVLSYLLPRLFSSGGLSALVNAVRYPSPTERWRAVRQLFAIQPEPYWAEHLHFAGLPGPPGARLGTGRIAEITVNILVPVLLLAARLFRETDLERRSWELLDAVPPPPNRMTREFPGGSGSRPSRVSALIQQGILEWTAMHSHPVRCAGCPLDAAGHSIKT